MAHSVSKALLGASLSARESAAALLASFSSSDEEHAEAQAPPT